MNLVGKIFVGVIALMSVVVLTLSVVSYSAHTNFKTKSEELDAKLKEARDENQKLTSQKAELASTIEDEKQTYTKLIAALTTKNTELLEENAQLRDEKDKLDSEISQRLSAVESNQNYIDDIQKQLGDTSDELKKAQELRANYLRDLEKTMEKLHALSAVLGDLEGQNKDILKAYDDALTVLNQNGLSADPSEYGDKPQFPVQGKIETVKQDSDGLVSVSIGSDDGLNEHNLLDVRRGGSYLGKIEVVALEPNRAVCRILPEYLQGLIQEGDVVYSQEN